MKNKTYQFQPVNIEVSNFLESLVNKLSTQDNRATQNVGFMVYHKVREDVSEDDYREESERSEYSDSEDYCDKCKEDEEEGKELSDFCNDCDSKCFHYFKREWQIDERAGVFLTEEACENHIAENHYHYSDGAKSYGISFWRNPEMVKLINAVFAITGKPMPSHYTKLLPLLPDMEDNI